MANTRPIPEGFHTVTPMLVCANAAEAIEFYKKAFGAVEVTRLPGPDGKIMHAQLRIGDSPIMLTEESPQWKSFGPKALKGTPVTIHLYVHDADATVAQAARAGATVRMPVAEQFWGDRYGLLEDPSGHFWSVATKVHDYTPEQVQQNFRKMVEKSPA
jgi:uncharacterized glyoxalase superfamily protein PhnB